VDQFRRTRPVKYSYAVPRQEAGEPKKDEEGEER
jgi:hypothetical protein